MTDNVLGLKAVYDNVDGLVHAGEVGQILSDVCERRSRSASHSDVKPVVPVDADVCVSCLRSRLKF
jgi:hypothetical protein